MKLRIVLTILTFAISLYTTAGEISITQRWCDKIGGKSDSASVTLQNGKKADCVVGDYVVEVDYGYFKWYEGVTQAMHYAHNSGKVAMLALIVRDGTNKEAADWRGVGEAQRHIQHFKLPIAEIVVIKLSEFGP